MSVVEIEETISLLVERFEEDIATALNNIVDKIRRRDETARQDILDLFGLEANVRRQSPASWVARLSKSKRKKLMKLVLNQVVFDFNYDQGGLGEQAVGELEKLAVDFERQTRKASVIPDEVAGFNVQLVGSATKEQITDSLSTLEQAADILRRKGYANLLYGDVFISNTLGRAFANYIASSDDMAIAPKKAPSPDQMVKSYIHELGHRYWYKVMSQDQRDEFIEAVSHPTEIVTVEQRENLWSWVKRNLLADMVQTGKISRDDYSGSYLRLNASAKERRKLWSRYLVKMSGQPVHMGVAQRDPEGLLAGDYDDVFIRPQDGDVEVPTSGVSGPTAYGRQSSKESFATSFASYMLDELKDENLRRILEVSLAA